MRSLAITALLLCGIGCKKGYDQSQMAKLTAPEQAIVGKYELKTELAAAQPGASTAEFRDLMEILTLLEGGPTILECLPDKSFAMVVGDTTVKGSWKLDKSELRLKIDKIGDMKPEQISRVELENRGMSGFNMSPEQRDQFLSAYRNSIALERAESVARLRVSADGTLFADSGQSDSMFGSLVSYFAKKKEK
jgi:hypothetical protein